MPPPRLTITAENMSMSDKANRATSTRDFGYLPRVVYPPALIVDRSIYHLFRYVSRPASDSTMDVEVNVPTVWS